MLRQATRIAAATVASLATLLVLALPALAQEGGHEPISPERKLLAAGILGIALVVMVAWAWLWKRVNRT
jgi:hypothetical protein